MEKVLVLATAPYRHVESFVNAVLGDCTVLILANINESRYESLRSESITVKYFTGNINVFNIKLVSSVVLFNPDKVIFIVGDNYFHDNVANALLLIKRISNFKFKTYCYKNETLYPYGSPSCALLTFVLINGLLLVAGYAVASFFSMTTLLAVLLSVCVVEYAWRKTIHMRFHQLNNPFSAMHSSVGCLNITPIEYVLYFYNRKIEQDVCIPGTDMRLHWKCTVTEEGRRAIVNKCSAQAHQKIVILGCSQSFGHFVTDEKVYSNILQGHYPDCRIVNLAESGASTHQMLEVLQQQDLKVGDIVVFGHISDHLHRNTAAFSHILYRTWKVPAVIAKGDSLKKLRDKRWVFFPYRTSALMFYLEYEYNRLLAMRRSRRKVMQATIENVFIELKKCCESKGVKLLICNIDNDVSLIDFFKRQGFNMCLGVNMEEKDVKGANVYTLFPLDGHINERGHAELAKSIKSSVDKIQATGKCFPSVVELHDAGIRVLGPKEESSFIYPMY